jgi:hypothetical protein
MAVEIQQLATIEFNDHGDGGKGYIFVRTWNEYTALAVSIIENGDLEVVLDRSVIEQLVEALQSALGKKPT